MFLSCKTVRIAGLATVFLRGRILARGAAQMVVFPQEHEKHVQNCIELTYRIGDALLSSSKAKNGNATATVLDMVLQGSASSRPPTTMPCFGHEQIAQV